MKTINEWLKEHAVLVDSKHCSERAWVTKARGDYITLRGMEDKYEMLLPPLSLVSSIWEAGKPINIGFNAAERKWYGWSHRAAFGFGIGSKCKKGDCHYQPTDKDDFLQDVIRFWSDADHLNVTGEHREAGVYVEWEISQAVPNEQARGQITGVFTDYPSEYGRGEWVAKTLADAQQMAIDFAESVA